MFYLRPIWDQTVYRGNYFLAFAGNKKLLDVEDQEKALLAKSGASAMLRVAFIPTPKSASKITVLITTLFVWYFVCILTKLVWRSESRASH